ncbi:hypothetical protein [Actinoplanes sp. NPDC051851]|uniref:hypothetical protein n=1 Tax=Actinoplanes sp. NPDC051851 TaxID=3154753 RepID=UPI00342D0EF4
MRAHRWITAALVVALLGGCGESGGEESPGAAAAAGGTWTDIGGTCPALTGEGKGVFDASLEIDTPTLYTATCTYGDELTASYLIGKDEGDEPPAEAANTEKTEAQLRGQPAADLTGVGEGGVIYADGGKLHAITWSGNATVTALVPAGAVTSENQLSAHTADLTAVLKDLLTGLQK